MTHVHSIPRRGQGRFVRQGAVAPLFAFILPVLFVLAGFAINLSYMQLLSTELKVSTDAAAHAGGRAMSIFQTTDAAWFHANRIGNLNLVGGEPLQIPMSENRMQFGISTRGENGYGRYVFSPVAKSSIDNNSRQATSLAVIGTIDMPLVFQAMRGITNFTASRRSIATQVDRDISLVLDRSGSMNTYKNESELRNELYDLYRRGRISYTDYRYARYYNYFTDRVVDRLSGDMQEFAYDRRYRSYQAPRHSRWYYLTLGVDAFLDVLENTDQEEQVSLVMFDSNAELMSYLEKDFSTVRNYVNNEYPGGATAIGDGLRTGLPAIINGPEARPFAAKTIVVLTDGQNNRSPDPEDVVRDIVASNNVTIHTVTFTPGADQSSMERVAQLGGGRHYHADDGSALIEIFEEIANNLPTILTE